MGVHYFFSFFSLPPPPPPLPPFILLFCGPYYYYYSSLNIYTLIYASSWRPFQRLPVPDIYIYFIFVFIYLVLFLLPPKYLVFFPSYFSCLFFLSHHWNSFTKYEQICCCCLFLHYKKKKMKSRVMVVTFDRFPCIQEIKVVQRECPYVFCFFLIVGLIFFSFFFYYHFFSVVRWLCTWWLDGVMGGVLSAVIPFGFSFFLFPFHIFRLFLSFFLFQHIWIGILIISRTMAHHF